MNIDSAVELGGIMQQLNDLPRQMADAEAQRVQLTEFRKSKKAMLMKHAERCGVKSAAAQEREAYAAADYIELIDALAEATKQREFYRYTFEVCKLKIELHRSDMAMDRAKMNML